MADIWTVQRILNWTTNYFSGKDIPEPRLSAELLLSGVLDCKRIELYVQFERILSNNERDRYREFVHRRLQCEPVQYILGETEFMGLPFTVNPDVLIPRPETERLVDTVYEHLSHLSARSVDILDIGTGSGCIAVALAARFPGCRLTAVEQSVSALETARENARRNNVQIDFRAGDFFSLRSGFQKPFDIVVCNPPYISENDWPNLHPQVREREPREALFGGVDGLDFYRRLAPVLTTVLSDNGAVFLETGYDQTGAVADLLAAEGFRCRVVKDYQQVDRVVWGQKR